MELTITNLSLPQGALQAVQHATLLTLNWNVENSPIKPF